MRARLVLFALGVAALGDNFTASAEPTTRAAEAQKAEAKIEFASKIFDFGRIKSGEVVKHDFVFTNSGTATLEISDVKPGCGCTAAGAWDKKVEPGKTGSIPLQFNSGAFSGSVTKMATVTCNAAGESNVVLELTGTIWKPIDVSPEMAVFSSAIETQTNETKVLHIVSNLEEPVTLTDLECTNLSFKAELKTVRPGKEFDLQITALPPFAAASVFTWLTLKTSSTEMPAIQARAYVIVQAPVAAAPQQVAAAPANQASPPAAAAAPPAALSLSPVARIVPTRAAHLITESPKN